jgi:hypothetical protein
MSCGITQETLLAVTEVRKMIRAGQRYVSGEIHFGAFAAVTLECRYWAKVYNSHPAIQRLANDWTVWVDRRWNEWGQHVSALTDAELRALIAADLA